MFGAGLYFCFIVMVISGLLFRERTSAKYEQTLPFTTVVIAARNEEDNLPSLLDDLVNQKVDKNKFEVIIANDRSIDKTEQIINEYSNKYKFIKAIHIIKKSEMAPKKYALENAINKSKGEIILATDADCRVASDWATSMASLVSQTGKVVIGYSRISEQNSLIHEIQQIDFLGIMAANAGLLTNGIVCSGSGQNLGYKKKDFFNIGGFEEVKHRESGDDMYIVQKISKIKGATFNYDKNSFVTTLPKNSLSSFINQRIRWSSNSKLTLFTSPLFFLFLTSAFLANVNILISLLFSLNTLIILIVVKFLLELLVLKIGSKLFLTRLPFFSYIVWNLTQPIYILIVSIGGLADRFTWKK